MKNKNRRFGKKIRQFKKKGDTESRLSVNPFFLLCRNYRFFDSFGIPTSIPSVALLSVLEHLSRFSQKIDGRCHTETTVLQHVAVFQLSVLSCLRSEKTPRISSFDCFYSSMQSPSLIFRRLLVSLLMALILRTTV